MNIEKGSLCAPLQKLISEHASLLKIMHHYYEIAEEIEYESDSTVFRLFGKLYDIISTFSKELKLHSNKEEEILFPMMAAYLGENDRMIEEMEREHDKAEQHLIDFLTEAAKNKWKNDETEAQWITVFAVQAYTTLIQHFANEEKVLFPLANKILSKEDIKKLDQLI